ncbi:MAG: hypothetical protein LBV20_06125, partial [Treponema sp.]|nr:hypothetical protein [Treponema sp.]
MRNIVIIFLFLVPALLFGGGKKEQELSASPEEQSIYRINAIDIQVEGRTQAFAIKDAANITSGTLIRGKKNLDAYIAEKKQFLTSQRVFENSALAFSVGDIDENNQIPVDLSISVKDSSNFVIVPAFKYDSNEGLFLKISPRNFNFFGTLTPMILGIGYERDTEGNNGFLLESDISLPFEFGGYIWTFDFANQLDIMQNSPTFYSNDLGLLVDIPLNVTTLTFGLYESIYVNEENDNRIKAAEGEFFRDVWYLNTTALARWNIPTGLKIFDFGELEYTPELDFSINYRPGGEIGDSRRGFEITLKQSLAFGTI